MAYGVERTTAVKSALSTLTHSLSMCTIKLTQTERNATTWKQPNWNKYQAMNTERLNLSAEPLSLSQSVSKTATRSQITMGKKVATLVLKAKLVTYHYVNIQGAPVIAWPVRILRESGITHSHTARVEYSPNCALGRALIPIRAEKYLSPSDLVL